MVSSRSIDRCLLAAGLVFAGLALEPVRAESGARDRLGEDFRHPPAAARPWVYWYWLYGAVSDEGITADLEAMQRAGLGGAYLMPVKAPDGPPLVTPPAVQLSPVFWERVRWAMQEADRLGIKLAMHGCDGWSLGGGPWITPENSMQVVTWSALDVEGGRPFAGVLPNPPAKEGYCRDIAVLAFPAPVGAADDAAPPVPAVTTSVAGADASYLALPGNERVFQSDGPCWVQYAYDRPVTCRSIIIRPGGNNYQANRLVVRWSNDGVQFAALPRLEAPRAGWQDGDADVTHSIPPTTARYFRFIYDPAGSEPGAEDLDYAKWRPSLKLQGILLSAQARIHQFEGKSGAVWRVGKPTSAECVPAALCVPLGGVVDLTARLDSTGRLAWDPPPGRWTVLRLGHTSNGHHNDTGGGAKGLECDKLNAAAARFQFDHWFGEAVRQAGPALAARTLAIFHTDSWECGSQNWTADFREEFARRRGYDLLRYLPAMAGYPVENAEVSERFLRDMRQTVSELLAERFFRTLASLAHAQGCRYSSETTGPTMQGDGLLHYREVDLPMGEFWLRSPTHDKLNDILDAVSGAHIYGKPIAQAEAFTELRIAWDEDPALFKGLADRNFAFGINRLVQHVFMENPWTDRRPGMTLNGVGSFFQRDQTWWPQAGAWVGYLSRCQAVLQAGRAVADIAVFTGEELPRRAVIPPQLISTLPGLFGADVREREARRLANVGVPLVEFPEGVVHGANISDPGEWTDALRGYAYDSLNADALLRLATVRDGRIILPSGASYALLVVPVSRPLCPDASLLTPAVAARIRDLSRQGATVLLGERPTRSPSLAGYPACDADVARVAGELWPAGKASGLRRFGQGRVLLGPWRQESLRSLGLAEDLTAGEAGPSGWSGRAGEIAWTHRTGDGAEVYFLSNQAGRERTLTVSLRATAGRPELWDPVAGTVQPAGGWSRADGRTIVPVHFAPLGSVFIVLRDGAGGAERSAAAAEPAPVQTLDGPWTVTFDPARGGPDQPVTFRSLGSWTERPEPGVQNYSGPASYRVAFNWTASAPRRVWLALGRVASLAEVTLNGQPCGVAWTPPYRVEVTGALRPGTNELILTVVNTWANRLIGDQALPADRRITWSFGPNRFAGKPLLPAGLLGPVQLVADRRAAPGPAALPPAPLPVATAGQPGDPAAEILWSDAPATDFTESYPVGNGRLGAMISGGLAEERLILDESGLWSGSRQEADRPGAAAALPEIRRLLLAGRNAEAEKLVNERFTCAGKGSGLGHGAEVPFGCYQTLGNLRLRFDPEAGLTEGYRRELDLADAVARVTFRRGGVRYVREAFASAPDQVVVLRLSADRPGAISFDAAMDRPERASSGSGGTGELVLQGQLSNGAGGGGVRFAARARVLAQGGTVSSEAGAVRVRGADEVVLLVAALTDLRTFAGRWAERPLDETARDLGRAAARPYAELLRRHAADYRGWYGRAELRLGGGSGEAPTAERLRAFGAGAADPALAALDFNYGRYLLISSSRPGGLPTNLQGIWAEEIQTPWNGDWHLNVNVQMNYWPVEEAGLPELHQPLFDLIGSLVEPGSRTARTYYGAPGWVAHVITNPWGFTSPAESATWGSTTTGSAWLCQHLWDHYLFTGDRDFLARAYPTLKGSAQFYLSQLIEEPSHHWLVTAPSNSPENAFVLA